jgi:hypothetical protein
MAPLHIFVTDEGYPMFWNNKSSRDRSAPSVARPSPKPAQAHVPKNFGLSVDLNSLKSMKPERNSDPYNTSGSFDRTKNWSRVGKR